LLAAWDLGYRWPRRFEIRKKKRGLRATDKPGTKQGNWKKIRCIRYANWIVCVPALAKRRADVAAIGRIATRTRDKDIVPAGAAARLRAVSSCRRGRRRLVLLPLQSPLLLCCYLPPPSATTHRVHFSINEFAPSTATCHD
jgi:hypothetical protein